MHVYIYIYKYILISSIHGCATWTRAIVWPMSVQWGERDMGKIFNKTRKQKMCHSSFGYPVYTSPVLPCTLQRRHNWCDSSQITSLMVVYSPVYSWGYQKKYQRSASLAFVRDIHQWPVNSPHKGPVTQKKFPLMTSSCAIPSAIIS